VQVSSKGRSEMPLSSAVTDKDIKIMRLQSDLRQANQAREDAMNEVIGCFFL